MSKEWELTLKEELPFRSGIGVPATDEQINNLIANIKKAAQKKLAEYLDGYLEFMEGAWVLNMTKDEWPELCKELGIE